MQDTGETNIQEDGELNSSQRCRQLCLKLVRLAARASECKEAYTFIDNTVGGLTMQVEDMFKRTLGFDKE